MAGIERRKEPAVATQLAREAFRFGFYQAVRLLEIMRPGSTPIGQGAAPRREPVRLRAAISMAFPAGDLAEMREGAKPDERDCAQPELTVNFMSLAGVHGPLPHPFTEHLLERIYRKDTALRDFLDLFHHRLLSLFYRVHRAHRVGVETGPPEQHGFASFLYSLLGMGTEGLRGRMAIPDRALLRYAGLLNKTPRDATGLTTLLSDFFGIPVRLEPLVGAFRPLDDTQLSSLGDSGRNRRLGVDTMLGRSVWDQQAGVRLVIGPLTFAQYQDFLPGGSRCVALCELSRFYLGPQLDVEAKGLVSGAERPPLALTSRRNDGAKLGWNAWLLARPRTEEIVEVDLFMLPQFRTQPTMPTAPHAHQAASKGA